MKKLFFSTLTAMTLSMFAAPATASAANPLVESSKAPFETVPFNVITPQDYENAIMEGIRLQNQEISAITRQRSTPTFENTIAALDRSGKVLNKAACIVQRRTRGRRHRTDEHHDKSNACAI